MNAPQKPQAPPAPAAPTGAKTDENIVTIPSSYYGVALKMEPPFFTDQDTDPAATIPEKPPTPTPPPEPPKNAPAAVLPPEQHSRWMMVGVVLLIVFAVGGGWVAWNREAIFGGSSRAPSLVVEPSPAPNPAAEVSATSTAPGVVRLSWVDRSESETGYRIERKSGSESVFSALQTLPPNSRTFLDPSAVPESRVVYRIVAFNDGGEAESLSQEVLVQASVAQPVATAPSLPPDGLDLDSDGLTDTEEALYGSNPQLADTDSDGYLDGNELFNLYAPTIKAPASMLNQLSVQTVSSTIGWQVLAPSAWTVERKTESTDVLLRAPSGEVFVVAMSSAIGQQDIRSWIASTRGWRTDQIIALQSNKYGLTFFLGPDRLTAYVPWDGRVLTISYQLGAQVFVNYRTTFGMIINALRLQGSPNVPDLSRPTEIPAVFQPQPLTVSSTASSTSMSAATSLVAPSLTSTVPSSTPLSP